MVELRKQARAEAEEAAFAERCGNREAICESGGRDRKAIALASTKRWRKRRSTTQRSRTACARSCPIGDNAEGFDLQTFKTSHPLQAPYTFAIHAIAEHSDGDLAIISRLGRARMAATKRKARAFADFPSRRDDWRDPPEPEPEGPVEYVEEATPEEMNNVVLLKS